MPNLTVTRSIEVPAGATDVLARADSWARVHGFRTSHKADGTLAFRRGGLIAELFSSDVRKLPIVSEVDLQEADGRSTIVTARLVARTRFGLFTARDRMVLEGLVDGLDAALNGRHAT